MPIRYIGREPHQKAKSLFEMCRQLRDFGVGRMVYKHNLSERFPAQKSYYRLTSVVPERFIHNPDALSFQIWGEEVFRGRQRGVNLITTGHKFDWILVPKEEEKKFCIVSDVYDINSIPLPTHVKCPPLLELIMTSEKKAKGQKVPEKVEIPFIANTYVQELDSDWA